MEKIELREDLKGNYLEFIRSAQQLEQSIGSADYRIYKLKLQRAQIDAELKTWWDNIAKEYNLDQSLDYYVDNEGSINVVEKPKAGGAPIEEIKDPAEKVETATNEEAQAMVDSGEATIPEEAVVVKKKDTKEPKTVDDLT